MKKFIQNTTYYLEVTLTDKNGDFVTVLDTGDTVDYEVRKSIDNSLIASGTMTVDGNVFKASISLSVLGQYRALYFTPTKYENGSEIIEVVEEITDDLSGITTKLNRLLGLSQENYRIFDPVYDGKSNLTSATIKIYPSASDVDADTNEIAEYEIIATYTGIRMTGYKVKKV